MTTIPEFATADRWAFADVAPTDRERKVLLAIDVSIVKDGNIHTTIPLARLVGAQITRNTNGLLPADLLTVHHRDITDADHAAIIMGTVTVTNLTFRDMIGGTTGFVGTLAAADLDPTGADRRLISEWGDIMDEPYICEDHDNYEHPHTAQYLPRNGGLYEKYKGSDLLIEVTPLALAD